MQYKVKKMNKQRGGVRENQQRWCMARQSVLNTSSGNRRSMF